jgi:hypothetical protein
MIRKLICALAILTLTTTPALARGSGGGFHGGGMGGFHGGGMGGFHGGATGGFHGGFHGGGIGGLHDGAAGGFRGGATGGFRGGGERGFHGGGRDGFHGDAGREFHGRGFGGRHDRFERFDHFHRFGFVGPAFSFGVFPFFWDPFWFPSPYPAYTYAPPLVIQPESQEYIQQPSSATTSTYWYYCVDAKSYYPYTQECPGGWLKVAPTPVG